MSMLLMVVVLACCSDENDSGLSGNDSVFLDNQVAKLCKSSWKLYGFGTNDSQIRRAEPSECSSCYVVKFNLDGTFSGKTTSNEFFGNYSTDERNLKIDSYSTTKVGEVGDGYLFDEAFRAANLYEITDGKLKLYYNDSEFLIFNPQ